MSKPTIAVATDFSSRADRAIDRAKLLAEEMDGRLLAVHATNLAADDAPDVSALKLKMHAATGLAEQPDKVAYAFVPGSPPSAICRVCDDSEVSVLAIGPARYNSIGDYFLGTAVDIILRKATTPVLVVKKRAYEPYKQIVAGTDFSAGSAKAIMTAAQMFPNASIHVLHAWQVPFQAFNKDAYVADQTQAEHQKRLDTFMGHLAKYGDNLRNATGEVVRGDAIEAMRKGLQLTPDALVVLGSHGESGFRQATIGSVVSDLLLFLEADTLVVNAKDA